ncbi:MAG: acetylxylan esterase [Armatimonadetes bacterium]|nr:acetylxylan esterase [Armatimonadota bacterium]
MTDLLKNPERVYLDWFHAVAEPLWRVYDKERAAVRTPEQWQERRNYLKAVFIDALGGFPLERPSPNPRVLGVLDRGSHTIERVVFESLPGVLVTANVYVPKKLSAPAPGVLVASGHWENPKTCDNHRVLCAALATKGYVVLIYDPIGQGERHMYIEGDRWRLGGCTDQHTHLGVQLAASGTSLARFMVWDSMRALDYLTSRPEVDPSRIGMTGCSGGGTNTAYTAALDERVVAAVPVCYLTTLEERQRSENIADYEQNLYGQTIRGLDHHEYIAMVAPRAICIGAAQQDFFPIAGTRQAYAAAKKIFELLGVSEKCQLVEVPGEHGYLPDLRRAVYAWFNRWLGVEADDEEPDLDLPEESELLCFDKDVPPDNTYRAVLAHVAERSRQLFENRATGETLRAELSARVRYLPELCQVADWDAAEVEGWQIAQVQASSAPPLAVARRAGRHASTVVVVASSGDLEALSPEADGAIILPVAVVPDLAARAQLFADNILPFPWIHGTESFLAFYCELLGRDILYLRAAQVLCGLQALECRSAELEATGTHAAPTLIAGVLSDRVASLRLVRALWSYRLLAQRDTHVLGPPEIPWAVLGCYDLPDVMALVAPRPLTVESPLGPDGLPLGADELPGLDTVRDAYSSAGALQAFRLIVGV